MWLIWYNHKQNRFYIVEYVSYHAYDYKVLDTNCYDHLLVQMLFFKNNKISSYNTIMDFSSNLIYEYQKKENKKVKNILKKNFTNGMLFILEKVTKEKFVNKKQMNYYISKNEEYKRMVRYNKYKG